MLTLTLALILLVVLAFSLSQNWWSFGKARGLTKLVIKEKLRPYENVPIREVNLQLHVDCGLINASEYFGYKHWDHTAQMWVLKLL